MNSRHQAVEEALQALEQEEEPAFVRAVSRIVWQNVDKGRLRKFLANESVANEQEYVRCVAAHYRAQRDYVHRLRHTDDPQVWEPLYILLQKASYRALTRMSFQNQVERYNHAVQCASDAAIVLATRPFPFDTDFKAWAFVIVQYICKNHVRKARSGRSVPDDAQVSLDAWDGWVQNFPDPASGSGQKRVEQRLDLLQCIANLSPSQREFVMLHYFEHKTYEEIAALMGRNKNALYKLNFDALNNLRKNMLLNRHNYE